MPGSLARCCCLLLLLAAGCTRYDPLAGLSETEVEAVGRITRDGNVRLWRTERDRDGHLIVWTRQGDAKLRYRVVEPTAPEQPAAIEVLDRPPLHPR